MTKYMISLGNELEEKEFNNMKEAEQYCKLKSDNFTIVRQQ